MKGIPNSSRSQNTPAKPEPTRGGLVSGAVLIAIVIIGVLLAFKSSKSGQPVPVASAPELKPHPAIKSMPPRMDFPPPAPVTTPLPEAPVEPVAAQPEPRTPAQLMDELMELSGSPGPITKEQAERFKQVLAELVRQGETAVPAIQAYLDKNLDSDYAKLDGGDQLSYSSLRASLLDTLKQIGGPEAQSAMVEVLQTTAVPAEVLELAKDLEQQAPGQYRDQILNAAHEALNMASANQLGSNVEVGPIFRVLQNYGGEQGNHNGGSERTTKITTSE
jgi:hypothetical protein